LQAEQSKALQQAQDQFDTQQDQANQARLLQREQELRTQNRLDNNPGLGGFDRYVYDQTGIRPGDASAGVFPALPSREDHAERVSRLAHETRRSKGG
jgi:hypothetical protein